MGEWRYGSTIVDLGIDGEEYLVSCSGRFSPVEGALGTQWMGGSRSRFERFGGEKKLLPLAGIEPRPSSPSLYRLSYPGCLQNRTVAKLGKRKLHFHGNLRFIIVFTTAPSPHTGTYPESLVSSPHPQILCI
jgi:hypothetical protein